MMTEEVEGDDLVPGRGWLTDDSDFYGLTSRLHDSQATNWTVGDDETKNRLEAMCDDIDDALSWQRNSVSPQKLALDARRSATVNEKKPAKLYFPHDGDISFRQSTETVGEFIKRLRPSRCSELEDGPWIWISNPHVVPGNRPRMDEQLLMSKGCTLLEEFPALMEKTEKQMEVKAKATVTRKMKPHLEKLRTDLHDVAVDAKCLSGKWMLFVGLEDIDNIWRIVSEAVTANKLGPVAKVATGSLKADNFRLICVYTEDFADLKDVRRVLDALVKLELVPKGSVARGIYYKNDAYTYWNITSNNEYKLKASLYGSKDMLKLLAPKGKSSSFEF